MFDGLTPLPPYTDPRSALAALLPSLRPAEDIEVTDAAERDLRVNVGGQWKKFKRDAAPYMVEPTNMATSRDYAAIAFCGPAQSGKTFMLQTVSAYAICADPGRIAIFQMSQAAARDFVRDKIDPMIRNSPGLVSRLAKGRGADTVYQKIFTGGTRLTVDWPTMTKLRSASIRVIMATDFDAPAFGESIDGEGDPFILMRARTRSFMSRGMTIVESSPGAPITDETWKPKTVHDCPPVRWGVLSVYPQGTRARWYWTCPLGCGEEFEPRFDRLRFDEDAPASEAGAGAEMMCPGCGGLFGHDHKNQLNRSGRWLHETTDGSRAVPLGDPDIRKTDVLSYWLNGTAAMFSTWAELVSGYLEALRQFERTGDETSLQAVVNSAHGNPYMPRASADDAEIGLQMLRDKQQATETPKAVAPSWTRYITVSVDTQGNRWDVGTTAWGESGRHQPIDRFEIHLPPEGAPSAQDRTVRPFDIAEDWQALVPLEEMAWPVEQAQHSLRAVSLAVDMQGGGMTTENAYRFYRERRKAGAASLWHLTRGRGGPQQDRVWIKTPERASGRRKAATDVKILNMATDRLKDAVGASLRLQEDGENICLVPFWMEEAHLVEYTAERRTGKGWEKRPGMVRNESLDHLVQARAQHILLGGEKIKWASPPAWAVGGPLNSRAVVSDLEHDVPAEARVRPPVSQAAPASSWIEPRKDWI